MLKFFTLNKIITALSIIEISTIHADLSNHPGHLKPLSYQGHRDGNPIHAINYIPLAEEFYKDFVNENKPVVLKGALNQLGGRYPAYQKWSDEYLLENYGDIVVEVERGKKEDRREAMRYMTLSDFIGAYRENALYMVSNVPERMEVEVLVFWTLLCGGFEKLITEAVMWFSSGGTSSLLHNDNLDNLNCLLDGHKDVILFDASQSEPIKSRGFNLTGGHSNVDVEKVDLNQFPQFVDLPWQRVQLDAGDCLYIPFRMFHQVNTANSRSIAVNLWFAHLWWFNRSSCTTQPPHHQPLSDVAFVSPNEQFRSVFLEKFSHLDVVTFRDFTIGQTEDDTFRIFSVIDSDNNKQLSWRELYSIDIDWLLREHPHLAQGSLHDAHDPHEL